MFGDLALMNSAFPNKSFGAGESELKILSKLNCEGHRLYFTNIHLVPARLTPGILNQI